MAFNPQKNGQDIAISLTPSSAAEWEEYENLYSDLPTKLVETLPTKRTNFLSKIERNFLDALAKKFINYHIFSQVQLIRLVDIDKSKIPQFKIDFPTFFQGESEEHALFNLISLLSVDFVIANKTGYPRCVIEVDGEEHKKFYSAMKDKFKNKALENAGIPILRITNEDVCDNVKLNSFLEVVRLNYL
ncbi:uncharacterized protein DUF2726 [Rahnella sp. BIGb0236]|uniref:DUF2726 domain-containing protein n=1 Tax=unclassified Rahnella TaxID=2635087 RepID=UPI000C3312F6|nr:MULTISPECIES: DUF2726 domain-containing protein [unclassified Rahnella]PKE27441.1 hypothetical protein CWS43_26905 [Rahnella sp. AA]TDS83447.1 uncharacterized protein DUF2726 [Rahnella sp. BIGb0236]